MGIHNLNSLFVNAPSYENMVFDTIIIDGSNLVITYLSAIMSSIIKDQQEECIIDRTRRIVQETADSIVSVIRHYNNRYSIGLDDSKVIVIFDSTSNPDYKIKTESGFKLIKAKELESASRAKRRDNADKLEQIIERMKLEGSTDLEIEIYKQHTYMNSPNNYMKTLSAITDLVVSTIRSSHDNNVVFLKALSETDFVIRALCHVYTLDKTQNCLVASTDTDYMVLLSDIERAYVKKIQTRETKIIQPYEAWRSVLNKDDITYEQICELAIIFGCDYNGHSSILTLDSKDTTKNPPRVQSLLLNYDDSKSFFSATRLRRIKELINKVNPMFVNVEGSMLDIISRNTEEIKDIMSIYVNWEYNTDFTYYDDVKVDLEEVVIRHLKTIFPDLTGIYDNDNYIVEDVSSYLKSLIAETILFDDDD